MLLVMAMVRIEDICELSNFVLDVHCFYERLFETTTCEFTLNLLNLFAGLVVEWMKELLLQPSLPRTVIRHVWGRAFADRVLRTVTATASEAWSRGW
jgi:hypothetical protein